MARFSICGIDKNGSFFIAAFIAAIMFMPLGVFARNFITKSASYRYSNEGMNYKLRYEVSEPDYSDSLWLHYNDTVALLSPNAARKFARLSASLFDSKYKIVEKKCDTICSNVPTIDVMIECAPRMEDKGLAWKGSISRQPTYTYTPEFLALAQFVEDTVAPYIYMTDGVWELQYVDTYPIYIDDVNGIEGLLIYIAKNMQWPRELDEACIKGKVILKVEITDTGSVGKIEVVRTPHRLLGDECVRVLKTLPENSFIPAERRGKNVPCWFTFPVNINLQ